ncbi:aldehyde dehydrogenase family protein [Nonomuraea sp. NPDC050556]|uniref:aldehyde dehydrogenase family protein n=1 Tax=Nonomuraea sp. NPDC050556 TaxID=3364369 RepID=UPI0037AC0BD4
MIGPVTINPADGTHLAAHPYTTPDELSAALDLAVRGRMEGSREVGLRELAVRLRMGRERYATLITTEMGKPIAQARAEIDKCALTCEYYAGLALTVPQPAEIGHVRVLPLGVVLAVMPWNYPFWQVIRSMVPALAIGNTAVLKHADNVTGCALAVQDLFDEAFGPGVLTTVVLPAERIGPLIDDPRIAAVAFTGSNRVGAIVAARAGGVVKKCVLELGGSDPFIVLDDADVEAAAAAAVRSRFLNAGQSCIAAKRITVHEAVHEEFVEALKDEAGRLAVGDPFDETTDVGPMARADLRDELRRQLDATLSAGGRLLFGGDRDDRPGAWFPPTLVEVDGTDNPAFTEETFGPLGAVLAVGSVAEAVHVANKTIYGLSASVWTADVERAQALGVQAGSLFVNRISESDPRLPVGGVKASGHGRELGIHGALEFANLQSVRTGGTA